MTEDERITTMEQKIAALETLVQELRGTSLNAEDVAQTVSSLFHKFITVTIIGAISHG